MNLWLHFYRPRPGWYELDADAQSSALARWASLAAEAARSEGAELLGEYSVRGQTTHERVQVWRFATVEAIEGYWGDLMASGYPDWRESENVIGVPEIPVAYAPAAQD